MSDQNPLVIAVLSILKNYETPVNKKLGVYDVIQQLEEQGYQLVEDSEQLTYELRLFQKNFLVMNALYQIQRDIAGSGYFLFISTLNILLCNSADSKSRALTSESYDSDVDQKMSSYYLDWNNFNTADQDSVSSLLNNFWTQFSEYNKNKNFDQKRLDSLTKLELESTASWEDIQQSYRKKVAQHHPDKGGDSRTFIEIREAFQILKIIFQKNQ